MIPQSYRTVLIGTIFVLAAIAAPRPCSSTEAFAAVNVELDNDGVAKGKVYVPKGETLNEDVVANGPVVIDGVLNGNCSSLGSSVEVRGEVQGDISTFGGAVTVSGTVRGDVSTLGGPVSVSGTVKGDISSLGGGVTLSDHASVLGDVNLMGGRLERSKTASIKGEVNQVSLPLLDRLPSIVKKIQIRKMSIRRHGSSDEETPPLEVPKELSGASRFLRYVGFVASTLGIGLMVILIAMFLPKNVGNVARTIQADFWRSAGVGTIILVLLFPGLILMAISILGIPLIPIAILLVCGAILMSLSAFSAILTERVCESLGRRAPGPLASVVLGYALLTGLLVLGKLMRLAGGIAGGALGVTFILANVMVVCCAVLVGMGAIWTTRMGSRSEDASRPASDAPNTSPSA